MAASIRHGQVQSTKLPVYLSLLERCNKLLGRILPVALGVVLDPFPQVLARILHTELRLPTELLVGKRRVGREVQHVTLAARHDLIRQVTTHDRAKGLDHLKDGAAATGTQVPCLDTRLVVSEVVESCEVAFGKVEDVDVVSDGGAVAG